jgi:hypothetical protein
MIHVKEKKIKKKKQQKGKTLNLSKIEKPGQKEKFQK